MKGWAEFFSAGDLMSLEQVAERYPNARRFIEGGVFISHAGADTPLINALVSRPLSETHGWYAAFQYSSRDGGKDHYKQIVRLAMEHCAGAVVVCSENSAAHEWVFAEVDWLLAHKRRVFVFRADETRPSAVHPGLGWLGRRLRNLQTFDRASSEQLQRALSRLKINPKLRVSFGTVIEEKWWN